MFEHLFMPFGLINALNTLEGNKSNFFIYLFASCVDNILVFNHTKEEHVHDLNTIFKRV